MPETAGHVVAACEGKQVYDSFGQAKRIAKIRWRKKRIVVVPHWCRYCQKVHLGRRGP